MPNSVAIKPIGRSIRAGYLPTALATSLLLCACYPCGGNSDVWPRAGVGKDDVGIAKTLISECCFRGSVRAIQLGNFDGDNKLEIAVVPQTGVYLFDAETLKEKAKFEFKKPDGDTRWFGISPFLIQGKDGFLIAQRGGGYGDVGLLDQSGKELWTFKPNPLLPPNLMVVDNTSSAEPRFYVGDSFLTYRLNAAGKVVWRRLGATDFMTLVRDQGSTEASIATAEYGSRALTIRTPDGEPKQKIKLPFGLTGLAYVQAGEISGFVIKSGRQVALLDRAGTHRFTYNYDHAPVRHGPTAVLVRLVPNQPPFLAIRLESSSATSRSVLTVLSLDGKRVYEEYLGSGSALGIAPVHGEARDRLIVVDGVKKLWAYEWKSLEIQSAQDDESLGL